MLEAMGIVPWWPAEPSADGSLTPPAPRAPDAPPARPVAAVPAPVPQTTAPRAEAAALRAPVAQAGAADWPALEASIAACQRCGLSQCRRVAVPGMGDRSPDWLVVGEAPGEEEDRQGLPFVGRAGQLLDRMLGAMGLQRGQGVYITNVVKCRPPQNRNPEPEEIAQCTPHLLRQIEWLRPKVVLAMGRFAAHTLLAEGGAMPADALRQVPLGKLRGQVHQITLGGQCLPLVVTYHPAYLLRSPTEKAKAWDDLCLALDTWAERRAAA
jgi:uracil-DNA glycosylase